MASLPIDVAEATRRRLDSMHSVKLAPLFSLLVVG